jgi:hypothetical protein
VRVCVSSQNKETTKAAFSQSHIAMDENMQLSTSDDNSAEEQFISELQTGTVSGQDDWI